MKRSIDVLRNSFKNRKKQTHQKLKLELPKIEHPKAKPRLSSEARSTVITVSTPFGFKTFTLGLFKKRALVSFATFTVLFLVIGSIGLVFSFSNNLILQNTLEQARKSYAELDMQNKGLKTIVDEGLAEKEKIAQLENMINVRSDSLKDDKLDLSQISVEQKTVLLRNLPNGSPVPFQGVTSDFGSRNHPVLGRSIFHEGIDLKASVGTKVYAPADGIVEVTTQNGGYGNMMIVAHSYGFKSVYGHLSRFALRPGEFVKKGQLIAFSGNTGLTAGPHLHYEVRFLGEPLNPDPFIKWNYGNFAYLFEREKKVRWASLVEATKWQNQAERLSSLQAQK